MERLHCECNNCASLDESTVAVTVSVFNTFERSNQLAHRWLLLLIGNNNTNILSDLSNSCIKRRARTCEFVRGQAEIINVHCDHCYDSK